jgi:conjugative relaxase-like TrwC/TraI family protein
MVSGSAVTKSGAKYSRYLAIGQYVDSFWSGRAAERLGIAGTLADESSFKALTELRNPSTGEQLKPKHKQKITLWDLTVSAPKSVSIMSMEDARIREAHIQAAALVPRVEEGIVPSKNLLYTQVHHFTSRAGDTQFHTHTPIINLTFNSDSGKWECVRQNFMNYYAQYQVTESYRESLAKSLMQMGYGIEDRPKQGFEIAGVSRELIQKFSQRSQQIEQVEGFSYSDKAFVNRPPKLLYAETYDAYIQQQKERLTQAERISLKETVKIAQEKAYKLNLRWSVGEAEESGPELKIHSYGHRISM